MANIEAPKFLPSLQEQNPLDLSVDKEENYRIGDISVYTGNKLKIPKEVLDSLDKKFVGLQNQVIDLTKSDLGNLQNLITQAEATKDYTKVEEALRKELIEAQVDSGKVKLDVLSTGAKGTIPEAVLNKVGSYIDTKLKYDFLDNQHKENIKIAIVGKILSSGKVDELLNSFTDITKKGGNVAGNFEDKFNTIIDTEMRDIISLLEKAKTDENQKELIKKGLLSNPKAIQEYTEGGDISKIQKLEGPELVNLLSGMNNQVINLEKKGGNIKEGLMATLSKMPSWLSEVILGFLSKILGFFLGEAQAEKMIGGFKKEIQNRKSVDNLLQYGNTINEKGEPIPGAKKGTIELFNDKNLNGLESKKLSKFFDNCREKGIDITEDNFWEKVFNKDGNIVVDKEEVKKDKDGKAITDKEGKEIKEKVTHTYTFVEIKKENVIPPDFTDFYKELNKKDFITDPLEADNPVVPVVPATSADKIQEQKEENGKLIEAKKKLLEEVNLAEGGVKLANGNYDENSEDYSTSIRGILQSNFEKYRLYYDTIGKDNKKQFLITLTKFFKFYTDKVQNVSNLEDLNKLNEEMFGKEGSITSFKNTIEKSIKTDSKGVVLFMNDDDGISNSEFEELLRYMYEKIQINSTQIESQSNDSDNDNDNSIRGDI